MGKDNSDNNVGCCCNCCCCNNCCPPITDVKVGVGKEFDKEGCKVYVVFVVETPATAKLAGCCILSVAFELKNVVFVNWPGG